MIVIAALLMAPLPADSEGPYRQARVCAFRPGSAKIELLPARTRAVVRQGRRSTEGLLLVDGAETPYDPNVYSQAEGKAWLTGKERIRLDKRTYRQFGLAIVLNPNVLQLVAEKDGVAVAADAGDSSRDIVYVLLNGVECRFQPYSADTPGHRR